LINPSRNGNEDAVGVAQAGIDATVFRQARLLADFLRRARADVWGSVKRSGAEGEI
jgi:hypothetical protein